VSTEPGAVQRGCSSGPRWRLGAAKHPSSRRPGIKKAGWRDVSCLDDASLPLRSRDLHPPRDTSRSPTRRVELRTVGSELPTEEANFQPKEGSMPARVWFIPTLLLALALPLSAAFASAPALRMSLPRRSRMNARRRYAAHTRLSANSTRSFNTSGWGICSGRGRHADPAALPALPVPVVRSTAICLAFAAIPFEAIGCWRSSRRRSS
jgi:hypothetical protein